MSATVRVRFDDLCSTFERILSKRGFGESSRSLIARITAESTRDGVHSHGINRFLTFLESLDRGVVIVDAEPVLVSSVGALERWDGKRGPGIPNAWSSMARAITLANQHGLGCVAVRNTNHWMRGGTYGLQSAAAGCIGVCWSNTTALMPPWGGREVKVGNNPLVIAIPRAEGVLLFDGSMSQFSMGRVLNAARAGETLPAEGGYDDNGNPTRDAAAIARTRQLLPIGLWKGSGLAIMLDCIGAILSEGKATHDIAALPYETDMTQVFLAIAPDRLGDATTREKILAGILADLNATTPAIEGIQVSAPGQRMASRRLAADRDGIEVDAAIWNQIRELAAE